jgi:hypothetical protein
VRVGALVPLGGLQVSAPTDWSFIKARVDRFDTEQAAIAFDFLVGFASSAGDSEELRVARKLIERASETAARIHSPEAVQ